MVVNFNKYIQKREKNTMFETLIKNLIGSNSNNGIVFNNISEIILLARTVLDEAAYYHYKSPTPVIKIAEDFGISTYKTDRLPKDISGIIYVGGTTKDVYGTDKIIFVDANEPLKHQRFIIAHEIAHFLLDCLPDKKYNDGKILFSEGYPKKNHDSQKEVKADAFAAELLMPSDLFIEQYNIAKKENPNPAFILIYLSDYFQTKISSIEKRIVEVFKDEIQ